MKLISIVVPVLNEQDNLYYFYQEICRYMENLPYRWELVFIDDGSCDSTPIILDRIVQKDSRVRCLVLARNFGHQVALTCGIDYVQGDAVITMDGDMQHPPELIPSLIAKWEQGFEIVQTIRINTEGVSRFKKFTSTLFYRLLNTISQVEINEGGSDFRLLDKQVVHTLRNFKERARFIRGIISSLGYRQTKIEFTAPKRHAGKSKFSFKKMLRFALDGITAYSNLPLRIAFYLGVLLGMVSLVSTVHVLYIKFFTQEAVPGWATISASVSFLSGVQLMVLGVIGEYIGRIFEEVKGRPLYWVRLELKKKRKFDSLESRLRNAREETNSYPHLS